MKTIRAVAATALTTVSLAGVAAVVAPSASAYSGNEKIKNVQLTLFGGKDGDNITDDNPDPRGIAWPVDDGYPTIHHRAAGNGTWENPTTLAVADPDEGGQFTPGTRFYIPTVHRYFIAEDTCDECLDDLNDSGLTHVDMWAGKNATSKAMDSYPANGRHTIIINPGPGRTVDKGPLLTH
jgi:hypothetical protein